MSGVKRQVLKTWTINRKCKLTVGFKMNENSSFELVVHMFFFLLSCALIQINIETTALVFLRFLKKKRSRYTYRSLKCTLDTLGL